MPPSTAVATTERTSLTTRRSPREALAQLEQVVVQGNLAALTENERIGYYARVCESLGLNPLTRPFEYITLNNKLTLYARKDATDQLRDLHGVTITALERERTEDLQIVTAHATDRHGRTDSSIGAVSIKGLSGEALANALMKAETKAKRRVTLSIVGLGWMDEIEALDQRAIEVAPRQALTSAIASRTAALTGELDIDQLQQDGAQGQPAMSHPGQEEAVPPGAPDPGSQPEEGTGARSATPPPAPKPPRKDQGGERAIGDAPASRSVMPPSSAPEGSTGSPGVRARGRRAEPSLKPGDAGYGSARAHAVAAERGLDHAAVHRIAADVLLVEEADLADFSVKTLDEVAWEQVIAVISEAPVDDSEAETFAGRMALQAGMGSGDDPWAEAEPEAVQMFDAKDAGALTAVQWREFGIRVAARNPLP